jgi:predicted transcriptional regulator
MKKIMKMTTTQINEINQLTIEGINPYQIAKRLNISPAVARYHVKKFYKTNPIKEDTTIIPSQIIYSYNLYKNEMLDLKKKFIHEVFSSLE